MASSPESSPPSLSISSPPPSSVDKSAPPPQSTSPPPESSSAPPKSTPPPEESKSSPPPSSSSSSPPPTPPTPTPTPSPTAPAPTPPSSSTPPPPPTPSPPPPTPPSSSTSPPPPLPPLAPPPPLSSSTKSSTPPSPRPLSNNSGSNQNNATTTNPTPSPPLSLSSPPPPPKLTSKNGLSAVSFSPKLTPPPKKSQSSTSHIENSSKSSDTPSSSTLPIIIGVSVVFGLLLILILALINATCNKKKKKSKFENHIQYQGNLMPQKGGVGYGNAMSPAPVGKNNMKNGYQANDHLVINLPAPPGGNAGRGGWPQTPSPQGKTPTLSSNDEMSSNLHGQTLPPAYPSPLGLNQSYFTYEELAVATQGFSQENLLGQGGFGFVHKGVLPNGKEVAVKSLKSGSGQGQREFRAEVEIISRVHHRHLVSLVGYSMAGDKKMLVYEFLPNKTLEFHLHEKGLPTMDWPTRLKIALGAAKGLAYLHEDCHPRIIHRDIKSANILLDFCFEAMVADFGLAKLSQDNNTHVSTRVMGTFGYLAPEYASSGKLTDKSDVFSFGVVLLELITGRRPLDLTSNMDESLVDWARPLCATAMEDGNFSQLVDPRLENNFVHHEMASLVSCAAACVRHSAKRRPKMRQIVRALEDGVSLDELNDIVRPGQSSRSNSRSGSSNDYDSSSYSADMKKFRKLAFDSQEYGSSNFGNTSQYGLNPSFSSSDASGATSRRQP